MKTRETGRRRSRASTPNRGAADVRAEIVAHLRADGRRLRKYAESPIVNGTLAYIRETIAWIHTMANRASKRSGGLGRKPKGRSFAREMRRTGMA